VGEWEGRGVGRVNGREEGWVNCRGERGGRMVEGEGKQERVLRGVGEWEGEKGGRMGGGEGWANGRRRGMQGPHTLMPCSHFTSGFEVSNLLCNSRFLKLHSLQLWLKQSTYMIYHPLLPTPLPVPQSYSPESCLNMFLPSLAASPCGSSSLSNPNDSMRSSAAD